MNAKLLLMIACVAFPACAESQAVPTSAQGPSTAPSTTSREKDDARGETLDAAARTFFGALTACDRETLRARTATFDEVASFLKTPPPDRAAYDADVRTVIDGYCRELHDETFLDVKAATDGMNVKRDVDVAFVVMILERRGEPHETPAFAFVKVGPMWKFVDKTSQRQR